MGEINTGERREQGLSGALVARTGELAITASAARAKAEVEAAFLVAINRPRNIMDARQKILDACKRPKFAESAIYHKPVGRGTIKGPSIRFAETAVQAMGNIRVSTTITYEDEEQRALRIDVTDLETNLSYGKDVNLKKTVERREPKPGQIVIGQRENTTGQTVYIVLATEDELQNKAAAAESKIIRNCGLRLIPQDIIEEAMDACTHTMNDGGVDPSKQVKQICDSFARYGIKPSDLKAFLGHPLEQTTGSEMDVLRGIYAAIKDGEATWSDYLDRKMQQKGSVSLDDLQPGKPEDHTEPYEAPKRHRRTKAEMEAAKQQEPPTPDDEYTGPTPTAKEVFQLAIKSRRPKVTEGEMAVLIESMMVDCEATGFDEIEVVSALENRMREWISEHLDSYLKDMP